MIMTKVLSNRALGDFCMMVVTLILIHHPSYKGCGCDYM